MNVKTSKLKFKGDSERESKKKHKKRKIVDFKTQVDPRFEGKEDFDWILCKKDDSPAGPSVIASLALDSPAVLTAHTQLNTVFFRAVEEPLPAYTPTAVQAVFVITKLPDSNKYSFKNAYDKYLSVDKFGELSCDKEAVGATESFEIVGKEDGFAIRSVFEKYLKFDQNSKSPRCDSDEIGFLETFQIKCQVEHLKQVIIEQKQVVEEPEEDIYEVEQIKKFHSSQQGRYKFSKEEVDKLRKAKEEGRLNEELVDRRARMKSDKFCK